ncbi:EamA-like transporter family protein [Novipirellula aureliae]|uniref:EamA-like transporter family protein n=1 Tax=Novipirellula aureliae TaxID=2527966 RepID=A0A5C6DZF6_9BACT|nr:DMT family transporter [Novipirellula aureliae]TWU41167.1 EamA-like transporter family protein [Novipirellula aureliae]
MEDSPATTRDYLKLHFIVFMWGFTSVLGELIDLPAIELVLYRCVIASLTLGIILRQRVLIAGRDRLQLLAVGCLIGLHWVLFFLAVKIANVSVCMVGMATISLWTAILEPLMLPNTRFRRGDLLFGFAVILAVAMIVQSELEHWVGFAVAIFSALVAAVFSILNSPFAQRVRHRVIAFYEMAGAALFCALCLPISAFWLSDGRGLDLQPSLTDFAYLVLLSVVCTVYAFSEYVELLKRLSVFTINFANNLEPVYGMAMGALLFADHRSLGTSFYVGAIAIGVLVLHHTTLSRRKPVAVN